MFSLIIVFAFSHNVNANEIGTDSDTILVEIIIGNPTDNEIANIELDDGSKLLEHEYEVISNKDKFQIKSKSYDSLGNYFNYAAWITRDGATSLSLKPNNNVRNYSSTLNSGWGALSSTSIGFGRDSMFKSNPSGLLDQYNCHFHYAKRKDYWNLEHWRPNVGYWSTASKACNP